MVAEHSRGFRVGEVNGSILAGNDHGRGRGLHRQAKKIFLHALKLHRRAPCQAVSHTPYFDHAFDTILADGALTSCNMELNCHQSTLPNPRVASLIVEDDQDDVFLLNRAFDDVRRILRRDIKTEHIENGLEALYLVSRQDLTENLPDILVLDLNMPKLDGIKFLRSLRQSLVLKDLPVYVLTTTTAKSIHEEAMNAGADRVYVKPDDAKALLSIALEMVGAGCGCGQGGEARHA